MLNPYVVRQICDILGYHHTLDLFASADHHQVPRYGSPYEDPQAFWVDSFAHSWQTGDILYANPPWSLIDLVLTRIQMYTCWLPIGVLTWTRINWYP